MGAAPMEVLPCKKCGGTGEVDPPQKFRPLYDHMKFVCERCGGGGREPLPKSGPAV